MKAGLKVLIKKEKVGDAVKEALISAGINSVASYGAGKIGEFYKDGDIGYGLHKFLHAGLGFGLGAAKPRG